MTDIVEGSKGSTNLVYNVKGLGVEDNNATLTDSQGNDICEEFKIEKYEEVQCLTKKDIDIDNSALSPEEYQSLDDELIILLNRVRTNPKFLVPYLE